jgi:short-subunit dehydrogenase
VTSFSQALDASYRERGCRVMALCPGFVHTEFHARMDRRTENIPSWMWLHAEDVVAEALAALDAGSALCIPSRRYRAIVTLARLSPRRISAAVAARRPRP